MSEKFCKTCLFNIKLKGEIHISIYPDAKVFMIDIDSKDIRKSFFLDLNGNIICPAQINTIMKNTDTLHSNSYFFSGELLLVIFKSKVTGQENLERNNYLNLSHQNEHCYLKVIYTYDDICVGIIQNKPDGELSQCLKLLPDDILDWQRLNICSDSIQVFQKEETE